MKKFILTMLSIIMMFSAINLNVYAINDIVAESVEKDDEETKLVTAKSSVKLYKSDGFIKHPRILRVDADGEPVEINKDKNKEVYDLYLKLVDKANEKAKKENVTRTYFQFLGLTMDEHLAEYNRATCDNTIDLDSKHYNLDGFNIELSSKKCWITLQTTINHGEDGFVSYVVYTLTDEELNLLKNAFEKKSSDSTERFSDVPTSHWAYDAIEEISKLGIINGYTDGTFKPSNLVTRAEFAKILVLALKKNAATNIKFEDVPSTSWAYEYVNVASNYLTGYKAGDKYYFYPDSAAVREDMAVAMVIAMGLKDAKYNETTINKFSDKDSISKNLEKYIAIAVENDLMKGNGDGTFNAKGTLTRAEAAQLILNALNVEKVVIDEENNKKEESNNETKDETAGKLKFKVDEATGTVDLGADYDKYEYHFRQEPVEDYSEIPWWFESIESKLLRIDGYEIFRNNTFIFPYLYIREKGTEEIQELYVPNVVLPTFTYNRENDTIDLGPDYNKYEFRSGRSELLTTEKYSTGWNTATQRILIGSTLEESTGSSFNLNDSCVHIRYSLGTVDSVMTSVKITPAEYKFEDIKYDPVTNSVNLGYDYSKNGYTFAFGDEDINGKLTTQHKFYQFQASKKWYEPTQNRLTRTDSKQAGVESIFNGDYLYISDGGAIKSIYVPNVIFSNITNYNSHVILGVDYKKYEYSYGQCENPKDNKEELTWYKPEYESIYTVDIHNKATEKMEGPSPKYVYLYIRYINGDNDSKVLTFKVSRDEAIKVGIY